MPPNRKIILTAPAGAPPQLLASDGKMYPVVNGTVTIEYLYIESGLKELLATGWTSAAAPG